MGSIQSMGIINALKTGDPKVDMILALLLPFALSFLLNSAKTVAEFLHKQWKKWWQPATSEIRYHERSIEHRTQNDSEGYRVNADADIQNSVLIKAIRLYCHKKVDIQLKKADMTLTEMADKTVSGVYHHNSSRTIAGVLRRYHIVKNPPTNEWHKLGQHGKSPALVELKIENQESRGDSNDNDSAGRSEDGRNRNKNVQVTTVRLRSQNGTAIDDFIKAAYDWYLAELRKSEDTSRYYYDLESSAPSYGATARNSSGPQQRRYTRFRLSSEKTFDSLFFPEKDSILKLVNSFTKKKGKYAIKGYPHKLGLLLHGPPGTGKTSFIKALAEHTGRNIVNVPLAKISTNAELTSVFFDKKYFCQGESINITLNFKDVIYVIEDVDAASDVVKRRDGKKTAKVIQTSHIDMPPPKSLWHMLMESENDDCKKLVKTLVSKSERLKAEASKPHAIRSVAKRMLGLPALGLVGETEDKTLQQLARDAINSSQALSQDYKAIDTFLGTHAKTIQRLLDDGALVDEELVDELLGIERPSLPPMVKKPLSRDVSYTKYDDSDKVHMEMNALNDALMKAPLPLPGQAADEGEAKTMPDYYKSMMGGSTVGPSYLSMFKPADSLNLQGILNVLDGVVDTPSRIVILTSNHPEHLDPALIRPGRIDKILHLGYMTGSDVSVMIQHYFKTTLDESQKMRIETTIAGDGAEKRPALKLTPAQVEQLAAENDTVDDMIDVLEEKACVIAATPSGLGATASSEIVFRV